MRTAEFVTDTATMCVFDPAALQHRLQDDADWWSLPAEELLEVNRGNVAFIGLGDDGRYLLEIGRIDESVAGAIRCRLKVPSGKVFVGAAEEVSSEGLEPEAVRGGLFLELPPGAYELVAVRLGRRAVGIHLIPAEGEPRNTLTKSLRL